MGALIAFVFVGLFSPGPNIVLLTASGARFGFRRTIPHLAGISLSVGSVAALTALGIAAALAARPTLEFALKCAAAVWILWLAWRLLQTAARPQAEDAGRPFTFAEAVIFQAANPKVWAVALAAAAGYPGGGTLTAEVLRLALVFMGINICVCTFWTAAGNVLGKLLSSATVWANFVRILAALLALSAALVFI
ncbi:MAG: LysE family translocator [Rhodobacteraceae bacterium]|nr:LysE family translocator [Paracoccaceae bacterium]